MTTYVTYETEYLNRRLREHCCRLSLPLNYAAKVVDILVDDLHIYEYEQKPITQEELSKLANLYRVSPSYFLGGISVR